MLQQTTVPAVRPRYDAFMAAFPDVAALARASEEEVLAAWSGLGYYRRARNLHAAARLLVREHGGEVPSTVEELGGLPGIGRYTAGAIASIAFGRPEALLDGNVVRLLSRLFRVAGNPTSAPVRQELWRMAGDLVDPVDPSAFNQGLMELGALVCRPRDPDCGVCPLETRCGARAAGDVERYPARPSRPRATLVRLAAALARDSRGRVLLVRRPALGAMAGLWELPAVEVFGGEPAGEIARRLAAETGHRFEIGEEIGAARHVVMTRRIALSVREARHGGAARGRGVPPPREHAWVAPGSLPRYPHSSLLRKALSSVLAGGRQAELPFPASRKRGAGIAGAASPKRPVRSRVSARRGATRTAP